MTIPNDKIFKVRRKILAFYRKNGRKLWFRATRDPYRIAVSEVMLQQTQVERVVDKYEKWIKRWPNWRSLAQADNREVLQLWSGLGYNRRALALRNLAGIVIDKLGGELPPDREQLLKLPSIGPYTANAILIFSFGKRLAAIDTNVRKVIFHEFDLPPSVRAAEIERLAVALLPRGDVGEWHHAIMDYARLALRKQRASGANTSHQSRYDGSMRQLRGLIVRELTLRNRIAFTTLARLSGRSRRDVLTAARALEKESVVKLSKSFVSLA